MRLLYNLLCIHYINYAKWTLEDYTLGYIWFMYMIFSHYSKLLVIDLKFVEKFSNIISIFM